jgi:hypothetical protein
MQKSIISLLTLVFAFAVTGQNISYVVLENNPEKAYSKFIAPEIGMESNSTNTSVVLGANGRYGLSNGMVAEGVARIDVYQLNGSGFPFLLEGGAFLPMTRKTKEKKAQVILSYNPYAGSKWEDGQKYQVSETKYLEISDAQFLNRTGVRGGAYLRSTGAEDLVAATKSSIFLGGIYLGGQYTSQAYVKTRVNDEVERIGAGFSRVYADLLVLPVSTLGDPAANDGLKPDGVIGWRVGFQWYVSPHDGDYKFLGRSVYTAELGKRPLTGFMFNMTWGWAIMNSR